MTVQSRILVVERDQSAAMAIANTLRKNRFDVFTAADGMQAIAMALKTKPNAVALNTDLPAGGGLNVLKRLRLFADTACVPVIAIASPGGPETPELLNAGAQEVLEAPASAARVCEALLRHLAPLSPPLEAPKEVIANVDRIAALESTGLINSDAHGFLDELTQLGSKLLGAPIMLVSLVHNDRQIFKSHVGLGGPLARRPETPLTHSFCQWVVSSNEPLIVRDAREHPALQSNLAIRDLGVIAYAGVPLLEKTSQAIGSFCAIDAKPREWSPDELATLFDLAKLAEAYTTSAQEKRGRQSPSPHGRTQNATNSALARAVGAGIMGGGRILNRAEGSIGIAERDRLLGLIIHISSELRTL